MKRVYAALALILMIPALAYAQDLGIPLPDENNADDYLLLDVVLEVELWEEDFELCLDMDVFCDILLELCLNFEVTDEEMYEIFPELWEPYDVIYPFWEDEWMNDQ